MHSAIVSVECDEIPISHKRFQFLPTSTLFEIKEVEKEGLRLSKVLLMLRWCWIASLFFPEMKGYRIPF